VHDKEIRYFSKYSSGTPKVRSNLKKSAYYHALSSKTIFPLILAMLTSVIFPHFAGARRRACVRINKRNRALSLRFDWIARDRTRRTSQEEVIIRRVYRGETYLRRTCTRRLNARPNSERQCNSETRALVAWPGQPIFSSFTFPSLPRIKTFIRVLSMRTTNLCRITFLIFFFLYANDWIYFMQVDFISNRNNSNSYNIVQKFFSTLVFYRNSLSLSMEHDKAGSKFHFHILWEH